MNNCPICQSPTIAIHAALISGQVVILMECEYWHQSLSIQPVSRFALTFGDLDNGQTFYTLDGLEYRKARPWSSEQWNANLWSDVNRPMFTRFEDGQQVFLYPVDL